MSTSDKSFYHGFISGLDVQRQKHGEEARSESDEGEYPRLHSKQVPGKYWIDQHACVFCGASSAEAPDLIRLKDDDKEICAYVFRQPETPEEEAAMRRAMQVCPTEAIMDTGTDNAQ